MIELLKMQCLSFLFECYFGETEDLLKAAIDRAYVDMASHTLKKLGKDKWYKRFEASRGIAKNLVEYPCDKKSFNEWHKHSSAAIRKVYGENLMSEGQAQKWLNMTIKYLFVMKELLGIEKLEIVKVFFDNTGTADYYAPLDSYVLKGTEIKEIESIKWSKIEKDKDYEGIKEQMDRMGYGFIWELENWSEFKELHPGSIEPSSYEYHCKNKTKPEQRGKKGLYY